MSPHNHLWRLSLLFAMLIPGSAWADSFLFDTGFATNELGIASRPQTPGRLQAADDFVLNDTTRITSLTFTGLLPSTYSPADIVRVDASIYRSFPLDSTNPPFGTVPTRVNSPSDVSYASRGGIAAITSELSFSTTVVNSNFTALNSILNGVRIIPNQQTGGEGPVTGQEIQFNVTLNLPITLTTGRYFFSPQVQLTSGDFYWLSAVYPNATGYVFTPDTEAWIGRGDTQVFTWLRVGTDIVGGTNPPLVNGAFSLAGETIPEPGNLVLIALGLSTVGVLSASRRARSPKIR